MAYHHGPLGTSQRLLVTEAPTVTLSQSAGIAMPSEPTNAEKTRRLPWVIAANATNSVFCTLTVFGSVFTLFLDELGLPKTYIGFILSLFPFCGVLAPFVAPLTVRLGIKRTFIAFWGLRKVVTALLLLTPMIVAKYETHGAFYWVAAIVLLFALCRAIAETAWYPWGQEIVPAAIRGKFSAVNMMTTTLCSAAAVWAAAHVIGSSEGLTRFMALICVGVFFGFASVACYTKAPGGASVKHNAKQPSHGRMMREVFRDKGFMLFLVGSAFITLGTGPLGSFLPLFVKEQIGLSPSTVVSLQVCSMLGGVLCAYPWGWAADRFGSKPVMLTGLNLMTVFPIAWMLMPRHGPLSLPLSGALYFVGGVVGCGWHIGYTRHLYVSMVPADKKTQYMALYYAWIGIMGAAGPLLAGYLIDACKDLGGSASFLTLGPYTPMLLASLALRIIGAACMSGIRADGGIPTGRFAAMFVWGNPFAALESAVRYNFARDEGARVTATRRLGEARSPLNVQELVEALSDPSFNVRYEAIVSISRARPDNELAEALIEVLNGDEPDLSIAAAWALGRMGDKRAIRDLRHVLESGSPLLQARSARALGLLDDRESIPAILDRFRSDVPDGHRIAYASALGALQAREATDEMLRFLRSLESRSSRMDVALAVARIVGRERYFVSRWREMRSEPGTAASQAIMRLRRRARRVPGHGPSLAEALNECADAFGRDDMETGARDLARVARTLAESQLDNALREILTECADRLEEFGPAREEYFLLSLHALNPILRPMVGAPRTT